MQSPRDSEIRFDRWSDCAAPPEARYDLRSVHDAGGRLK
jgi:hypothetical protein